MKFHRSLDFNSSVRGEHAVPVLAAPYLSRGRQALCREASVFFLDLSGNVFIAHGSLYVERIGFPNKYPEKRQLYLDLFGYPLRGREQAEHLYNKRLKKLFSGTENND